MPITVSSPEIANYDTGRTMPKPSQTIPNHPKPSQTMHASPKQSQTGSQTIPNHSIPKQSQTIPNNSYHPQTIPNDPVHFQAAQSTVEPCAPVNFCTTTAAATVRHVPEGDIAPSSLVERRLSTAELCSIVESTVMATKCSLTARYLSAFTDGRLTLLSDQEKMAAFRSASCRLSSVMKSTLVNVVPLALNQGCISCRSAASISNALFR